MGTGLASTQCVTVAPAEIPDSLFRLIFDRSPVGECLLSPTEEPIILAVNAAFLRGAGRKREEVVSQRLFDVFPADPNDSGDTGLEALRSSLRRVLTTGEADELLVQRYPIPVAKPDGTQVFEERYWCATNTPIFGMGGQLLCISHRTEDVTEKHQMQEALRNSQTRSQAALNLARLGTFEWNLKTKVGSD